MSFSLTHPHSDIDTLNYQAGLLCLELLFSHSVMFNSLRPHGLQHTRLPCPSLSPRVCSNSCPLGWWCHPTISSSVTLFSCPQSFLASESFPVNWLFASGGQRIGASASASVLPVNIQGWFPCRSRDSQESSSAPQLESINSWYSTFSRVQLSHPYMTTGKAITLTRWIFVSKVTYLLFNRLSRLLIAFLPRSKHLLISWLQSPSAVILEAPQNKVWQCFYCFPVYLPWSDGSRCHDLYFLNAEL